MFFALNNLHDLAGPVRSCELFYVSQYLMIYDEYNKRNNDNKLVSQKIFNNHGTTTSRCSINKNGII